eukprot:gene8948-biopygen1026
MVLVTVEAAVDVRKLYLQEKVLGLLLANVEMHCHQMGTFNEPADRWMHELDLMDHSVPEMHGASLEMHDVAAFAFLEAVIEFVVAVAGAFAVH